MNTPTLSKKLRSENKRLHGSFYVVMMAIIVTVVMSIGFLLIKGMVSKNNKKENISEVTQETEKEIKETSIENKTNNDKTYKVESGDTMYEIGIKLGVDWKEMAELNDIEPPYSLSTGQELKIPEGDNKEE